MTKRKRAKRARTIVALSERWFLSMDEAAQLLGLSIRTLYRRMETDPAFPQRVRLSDGRVGVYRPALEDHSYQEAIKAQQKGGRPAT